MAVAASHLRRGRQASRLSQNLPRTGLLSIARAIFVLALLCRLRIRGSDSGDKSRAYQSEWARGPGRSGRESATEASSETKGDNVLARKNAETFIGWRGPHPGP
jgi:hypothetical protein